MKNLIVGSLIALAASQAAGCIITSGDDDPIEEDAYITANWEVRSIESNAAISCPPGVDTAALVSKSTDGAPCDPILGGSDTCVELFDCGARSGVSAPLVPNIYQSWIQLQNHDGSMVYAKSIAAIVDVIDADKSFSAQILADGGYFQFAWDLVGEQSNASLGCAEAGVTGSGAGIQLQAFISGSDQSLGDIYDCEEGIGDLAVITPGYLEGDYEILLDAVNPDPVGSAPVINATIDAPNEVTNLGRVMIPITGL